MGVGILTSRQLGSSIVAASSSPICDQAAVRSAPDAVDRLGITLPDGAEGASLFIDDVDGHVANRPGGAWGRVLPLPGLYCIDPREEPVAGGAEVLRRGGHDAPGSVTECCYSVAATRASSGRI